MPHRGLRRVQRKQWNGNSLVVVEHNASTGNRMPCLTATPPPLSPFSTPSLLLTSPPPLPVHRHPRKQRGGSAWWWPSSITKCVGGEVLCVSSSRPFVRLRRGGHVCSIEPGLVVNDYQCFTTKFGSFYRTRKRSSYATNECMAPLA